MLKIIGNLEPKNVLSKFEGLEKRLNKAQIGALDEASSTAVIKMKGHTFLNYETGNLINSISKKSTGEFERQIAPWLKEDYPYYLEKGTKPRVIEGSPYLYWEGADHPVRRVNHPGTKPYPYVAPTRADMKVEFPVIVSKHVNSALRG